MNAPAAHNICGLGVNAGTAPLTSTRVARGGLTIDSVPRAITTTITSHTTYRPARRNGKFANAGRSALREAADELSEDPTMLTMLPTIAI